MGDLDLDIDSAHLQWLIALVKLKRLAWIERKRNKGRRHTTPGDFAQALHKTPNAVVATGKPLALQLLEEQLGAAPVPNRLGGAHIKDLASKSDIWAYLIALAEADNNRAECSQLQPFWHVDDEDGAEAIERLVPIYPFSRDKEKLEQSLKVLTFYRLTFGQPRQDELLNYLLKKDFSAEEIALIKKKFADQPFPADEEKTSRDNFLRFSGGCRCRRGLGRFMMTPKIPESWRERVCSRFFRMQ